MITVPNPGLAENGATHCNEQLWFKGEVVGYCQRWVKRPGRWSRTKGHRGPHRIEWWTS